MIGGQATELTARAGRTHGATVRWLLAAALVLVTTVTVLVRTPQAYLEFVNGGNTAADQGALNGTLAAADSFGISEDFLLAALALPPHARYAVLLPASAAVAQHTYGINPLTFQALPGFMLEVLLPRVPVSRPEVGDWVLCYDCDTSPWDQRTRWKWGDPEGHVLGQVYR